MDAFVTAKKPYLEDLKLGRGDKPEDNAIAASRR